MNMNAQHQRYQRLYSNKLALGFNHAITRPVSVIICKWRDIGIDPFERYLQQSFF